MAISLCMPFTDVGKSSSSREFITSQTRLLTLHVFSKALRSRKILNSQDTYFTGPTFADSAGVEAQNLHKSHGCFRTYSMYHHSETNNCKLTNFNETKKRALYSQTARV